MELFKYFCIFLIGKSVGAQGCIGCMQASSMFVKAINLVFIENSLFLFYFLEYFYFNIFAI